MTGVVDTGFGGGSVFEFRWSPPNYDALGHLFEPLRYGRVDIDLGDGRSLEEGVIVSASLVVGAVDESTYDLRIATSADLSGVDMNGVAIRVLA